VADLVAEFFERDLGPAEAAELEQLFADSASEAERFAALALAEYKSTGLPQPRWMSRRFGPWKWPLALLLAAAATWAFMPSSRPQRPDLGLEGEAFSVAESPRRAPKAAARAGARTLPDIGEPLESALPDVEAPRLSVTRKASEAQRQGSRLGVLVKQAVLGQASVTVKDSQGRELLELFDGPLPPGSRRFEWDGRLADGSAAAPGSYSIEVRRGNSVQTKPLTLKSARP
jgi:hypothetical protein